MAGRPTDANQPLRELLSNDKSVLSTDEKMAMPGFGRLSNASRTSCATTASRPHRLPLRHRGVLGRRRAQFGKAMLQGVNALAEGLGVRRVMLSALPNVVGYYHRFLDYDLVTRSGRSLEYLQNRPVEEASGGPYRVPAKTDPAVKDAFKNGQPESSVLDVYTSRKLELSDLHDPNLCPGDSAAVYGTTVYNPPEPYYYAHASSTWTRPPRSRRGKLARQRRPRPRAGRRPRPRPRPHRPRRPSTRPRPPSPPAPGGAHGARDAALAAGSERCHRVAVGSVGGCQRRAHAKRSAQLSLAGLDRPVRRAHGGQLGRRQRSSCAGRRRRCRRCGTCGFSGERTLSALRFHHAGRQLTGAAATGASRRCGGRGAIWWSRCRRR